MYFINNHIAQVKKKLYQWVNKIYIKNNIAQMNERLRLYCALRKISWWGFFLGDGSGWDPLKPNQSKIKSFPRQCPIQTKAKSILAYGETKRALRCVLNMDSEPTHVPD